MKDRKILIFLLSLLVANVLTWNLLFYLREDNLRVVFFDVGQGDAVFIKTPQNHHILIDGGPGSKVLEKIGKELPFLYNSIDLVILTHPHDDHVSGLIEVLKRHNVEEVVCSGVLGDSAVSKRWHSIIKERGYRVATAGQRISTDRFYIDILFPVESFENEKVSDLNTASVISRLVYEDKVSFLFMGDAYKEQERELLSYREKSEFFSLDSDVLKVGHHGSRTSTAKDFLQAVSPKVAVIMSGEDNRFGHPHKETLNALEKFNVKVMRTDKKGDVIFLF